MTQHLGFVEQATPPALVFAAGQKAVKITPDHRRQRLCQDRWRPIAGQVDTSGGTATQTQTLVFEMVVESSHQLRDFVGIERIIVEVERQQAVPVRKQLQGIGMQQELLLRLPGVGQETDRRSGKIGTLQRLYTEQLEQTTCVADRFDESVGTGEQHLQARQRRLFFVLEPVHGAKQTGHEQVADQTVT